MDYIYHITSEDTWKNYLNFDELSHSSLQSEGFIHCCTFEQINTVANRFYQEDTKLFVFKIDTKLLSSKVVYEMSDNDLYPHIYGTIQTKAINSKLVFERIDKSKIRLQK